MNVSHCRFYENKYPEVDDVVMVNVQQIAEMGAYVKLLEYDDIEGMVLLSELSRRRIRSIQKLIRVGRNEVAVVLRVDKEKGYIDLSKRRVSTEDIVQCEERYNKSKAVHSIVRRCAEKFNVPLEDIYKSIVWPLAKEYGHAFDAFRISITNPSIFDSTNINPPSIDLLNDLKENIARRLSPQAIKCRADIDVSCFSYEGIDAIKESLTLAENLSDENNQIKVKLVAAPRYVITAQSLDKNMGIEILNNAIEIVNNKITSYGGVCDIAMAPKAVTATEDAELQALLERKEMENNLDSDDDDEDDDDDDDDE
ncbi:translation initiation factor eIF2 subunit alpha [Pichia kluyveri]|uniref:Translation initiation factor eIF2 subunit alpha n=1 Tax=Pichia kluyveri TaxID=36015 RepID=A0AAV5QY59_PICKL|nr:translation initiation factor eIF2 subunit alpha [Pichia kluyveri]